MRQYATIQFMGTISGASTQLSKWKPILDQMWRCLLFIRYRTYFTKCEQEILACKY